MLGCSFGAVDVWLYAKLKKKADSAGERNLQVMVTTYVALFICAIAASFWSISDQTQIGWLQDFSRMVGLV